MTTAAAAGADKVSPLGASGSGASFTETRRYQRRPDLTAQTQIPPRLVHALTDLIEKELLPLGLLQSEAALHDKLQKIVAGDTPDAQLRCLSSISQILRRPETAAVPVPPELLSKLAEHWVFPWLMECSIRYTHKPLVSLLRNCWPCDGDLEALFERCLAGAEKEESN